VLEYSPLEITGGGGGWRIGQRIGVETEVENPSTKKAHYYYYYYYYYYYVQILNA
jgi:hypothetical protein